MWVICKTLQKILQSRICILKNLQEGQRRQKKVADLANSALKSLHIDFLS